MFCCLRKGIEGLSPSLGLNHHFSRISNLDRFTAICHKLSLVYKSPDLHHLELRAKSYARFTDRVSAGKFSNYLFISF